MKKYFYILLALLLLNAGDSRAQAGRNCFNTQFHNGATDYDPVNATLLGYLTTMVYSQYLRYLITPIPSLTDPIVSSLYVHDDQFQDKFATLLNPYFTASPALLVTSANKLNVDPALNANQKIVQLAAGPSEPDVTFKIHAKCNPGGYDPEAMLISTPSTIYVVFRGTDRVSCNATPLGYQWAEWLASDFKFLKRDASVMNARIPGQVHRGMVESLMYENFADTLAAAIAAQLKNKITGVTKKVWIAGHSLGGAHAQLFAMFLKYNYNITAQGLYLYESPHPGDQTFANQLNTDIGKTHIQRFEFGDDPIPTLAPQALLFGRAGVRNYFKDYNSPRQNTEQIPGVDDLKILCALGNLPLEQIPQTAHFVFPPTCPGSLCFHHPTFILQALRHQLNSSALSSLPAAVPLPPPGDNCNAGDLTKAENNDLINNTVTAVEQTVMPGIVATANAIDEIAWSAGNLLGNLIGSGLQEGRYKISSYAFGHNAKRYLNWNGTNNSQLAVSASASVFTLTHKLTGGYQLYVSGSNMASDVTFNLLGAPTGTEHTNHIIMKTKDAIIGDEETWYFFNIQNPANSHTYAILNWNTQKVLNANNNCLSGNACDVTEAKGANNVSTQVWVLEPAN
jgi:hypothetical protein